MAPYGTLDPSISTGTWRVHFISGVLWWGYCRSVIRVGRPHRWRGATASSARKAQWSVGVLESCEYPQIFPFWFSGCHTSPINALTLTLETKQGCELKLCCNLAAHCVWLTTIISYIGPAVLRYRKVFQDNGRISLILWCKILSVSFSFLNYCN